ncbi:unnamed protein product [Ixodes pacificus]
MKVTRRAERSDPHRHISLATRRHRVGRHGHQGPAGLLQALPAPDRALQDLPLQARDVQEDRQGHPPADWAHAHARAVREPLQDGAQAPQGPRLAPAQHSSQPPHRALRRGAGADTGAAGLPRRGAAAAQACSYGSDYDEGGDGEGGGRERGGGGRRHGDAGESAHAPAARARASLPGNDAGPAPGEGEGKGGAGEEAGPEAHREDAAAAEGTGTARDGQDGLAGHADIACAARAAKNKRF